MSAYEAEPVREPERRISPAGWVAVWVMYAGVLAAIGAVVVWLGGGAP